MHQLPIDSHLEKIDQLINQTRQQGEHQKKPLILTASPGSGKTTRLPAYLLKKLQKENNTQKIIVIVPKRVSAVSAADRISEENDWLLGSQVGYQVRFEQKISTKTQLIFMTEGLFLKRIQHDSFWNEIHTLILDEFHERSSHIDLILGLAFERFMLKSNFNLIVMSATLHIDSLQSFFIESHAYNIDAPPHPLEIIYSEKTQKLTTDDQFYQSLKETLLKAWKTAQKDILVFLPGYKEIIRFKNIITPLFTQNPIEILHGSIPLHEQKKIVQKSINSENLRRIILTTNIAESSITVNGLDCVIDSGLQKTSSIESKLGFSGLNLERISLFSAHQRAGRAAREQKGYCFRLWHNIDELSMKDQNEPQILLSTLIEETLLLKQQNVKDISHFSWLTKPTGHKILNAQNKLNKWELITADNTLTNKAKTIVTWPISIENALIYYELISSGFTFEATQLITVLDSGKIEQILNAHISEQTDLEKILEASLSRFKLEQNFEQIKNRCSLAKKFSETAQLQNFTAAVIQTYVKYFPEKICFRKNNSSGVSMFGRGTQTQNQSVLAKQDYYVALAGQETHAQFTQIIAGIGFDKKFALELFSKYAKRTSEVFFDFEKNDFYKNEKLVFATFVLNDFGKTKLSAIEVENHWKDYFKNNAVSFLKSHIQYTEIKIKLQFIDRNQNNYFKIDSNSIEQINNFDSILTENILNFYTEFIDFKNSDIYYLSYQFLTETLSEILQNLPQTIKSSKGKTCTINYNDDKSPLISLKIQDAFGWSDTPKIYHNKIPLTLELLAPNMRPAQITNKLAQFWITSYLDVRKDLRARYPKHDWPEDPRN